MKLFRMTGDGSLFCADCLPADGQPTAVELDPALFPGTRERLCCSGCGAGAGSARGGAMVDALPGDGAPRIDGTEPDGP